MQIWQHTPTASTGNMVGFLDVTPENAAIALIETGNAQEASAMPLTQVASGDPTWRGNGAFVNVTSPPAPTVTTAPTIAGNVAVGSTLTVTPGDYANDIVITRRWLRAGKIIDGERGTTYVTVPQDISKVVTCRETASNIGGSVTATSNGITVTS